MPPERTKVSEDQEVKAGDLIGLSDETGSLLVPIYILN